MAEERDYIYLKGTEELGEVIDALKEIEAKEIIIIVPRNTKSFLNATNLKILKNELSKLRKKVYIDSDDQRIISLAKEEGLDIFLSEYALSEATKIVTDILPPQKPKIKVKTNTKLPPQAQAPKPPLKNNLILIILVLFLILLGGYYILSNNLSSATLIIKLKNESLPLEENLTISANASIPDLNKGILPGEYIEIDKNHSLRQKTTGIKSERGTPAGKVKFINTDSVNSISIIPGTRIQSPEGYIYRTIEKVYLEPNGEKEVTVFAEKNDPKYYLTELNTSFTIPGLKGTSWENKIEVKLIEPIIASEEAKFVSLDDINEGKLNLEKQLQEIIKQELKLKYANYIFPEELGIFDVKFLNFSHSVGQKTDEVIITGSASLKTIGIKEADLKNFLKDVISKQNLRKDLNFQIVNLKINSLRMMNLDLKNKEMLVTFKGEIEAKSEIESKKLVNEIAGLNTVNIKEIIDKNYPQIEKAEILIFPPWLNHFPFDISKINVKIK